MSLKKPSIPLVNPVSGFGLLSNGQNTMSYFDHYLLYSMKFLNFHEEVVLISFCCQVLISLPDGMTW